MQTIKNTIGNETKIFAETFEYEAFDQVKKLANSEAYQGEKIRIMPDAHAGKGCTVGTTMTISDKVTPNLVGVDIGCGMLAVKLKNKTIDFKELDEVVKAYVPNGTEVHKESKKKFDFDSLRCIKHVDLPHVAKSLGTLGGGNHFIEIGKSELDGSLYLIIHSGSRKLGVQVCKYYQDKAFQSVNEMTKVRQALVKKLTAEGRTKDIEAELKLIKKPPVDKDLAYLTGDDFEDYMNDMAIVQKFASENRKLMADIIMKEMGLGIDSSFESVHNYIDFKRKVLRKGATSAELGETLLIPINMLDGSLICRGKGNEDWNYSAPHGAGRVMSRSKAKANIDFEYFKKSMKGVYSTSVSKGTLDESPKAYKKMAEIKAAITDTVEIVDTLKPVYNFKAQDEEIRYVGGKRIKPHEERRIQQRKRMREY